jgi:hypothetical protein
MPQLLIVLAAGAGLYTAYKWLSREAVKAELRAHQSRDDLGSGGDPVKSDGTPKDLGQLVWDAQTGSYRPKNPG